MIHQAGNRLYYLGNIGLSDEEREVYSQVSEGTGCVTKAIAVVLALIAAQISWQLFIGISGTRYNNFEPSTFFQNESPSTLYFICGLSVAFAAAVARLVYCVVLLIGRKSRVNNLAADEQRRLQKLVNEKRELKNKLEKLEREIMSYEGALT